MNRKQKFLNLIAEEVSSSLRKSLIKQLEEDVEECIDKVMLEYGVESQGLSQQQAALVYRKLSGKIEDVIDDYTTTSVNDPELKKKREQM